MYVEPWQFWLAVIFFAIWIYGVADKVNHLDLKNQAKEEDDNRKYKSQEKRIRELERWLHYLHPNSVGEEARKHREMETSKAAKKQGVLYWCEKNGKTKKETDKILKETMEAWEKTYEYYDPDSDLGGDLTSF